MQSGQWSVYVIHSAEGLSYVGMSRDIEKRLAQHNAGNSKYTRRGSEWKITYHELYDTSDQAHTREKYFKNNAGR